MPEVLIDESELQHHRNLSGFLQKALANPKTRRTILEAQKTLDPNAVIPELDAAVPLMSEIAQMREELKVTREAVAKDKDDRSQAETLNKLRSKWEKGQEHVRAQGYSEDGIKAVEKLMEEEGINNHAAGLAYFEKLNPPADPISVGSNRFDMFTPKDDGDTLMKDLMESGADQGVFNGHLNKVIADIRSSRGSR